MLIKNYQQLAISQDRKIILDLLTKGIEAVMPNKIMSQNIKFNRQQKILTIKNKPFKLKAGRIFVVGGGKAVGQMAVTLENIIGTKNITAGVINCVSNKYKTKKIKINQASHPTPNKNGLKGVQQMLALRKKFMINANDIIICLISGGGSSLLPFPRPEINLQEKQLLTKKLITSGANIQEINTVRKHLSLIKGGQLANFFAPTKIISLIISDVADNDLSTIASGITAPDKTSWLDTLKILKKYQLWNELPIKIINLIKNGVAGKINDTPKRLNNSYNYIIADNFMALQTIRHKARQINIPAKILTHQLAGTTEKAAEKLIKKIQATNQNIKLFIAGGETTPHIPKPHGQGGRNQHFALATAISLNKLKPKWNWTMASLASDGVDFIKTAAGAITDKQTWIKLKKKRPLALAYLNNFDSYNFFRKTKYNLIKMDNTGTNVGDIMIYLIDKRPKLI